MGKAQRAHHALDIPSNIDLMGTGKALFPSYNAVERWLVRLQRLLAAGERGR
jgi:hypothetical protein